MATQTGVIIVNFNSARHTLACIDSLVSEPTASITVWDNGSNVADVELLRSGQAHREFDLVEGGANIGFGAGVNRAVETARQSRNLDFIWLLNPDIIVRHGALGLLVSAADREDLGMVSPKVLKLDNSSQVTPTIWYAGGEVDRSAGRSIHWAIGRPDSPAFSGFSRATFISGAAPLIRVSAWDLVGGFDESYFLYCEDADLSIRALQAGIGLGVELDSAVEHLEGGSSGSGGPGPVYYYYVQRNRLRLYSGTQSQVKLLIGPGFPETIRLLLFAITRSRGRRWASFRASVAGMIAGIDKRRGKAAYRF